MRCEAFLPLIHRAQPVPMRACENFGHTSAPFLLQRLQVKFGSMSESRTSSAHPSALVSDVVAAAVVAAIDIDVADAGGASVMHRAD
jgi:hypothetical protein